ncbi:MAG: 30S ribosomal protein S18 [Deltaproteobacteria bacterium]|nr:30S ribosomal protein S18 [Deltaproteobacteria bacterium]
MIVTDTQKRPMMRKKSCRFCADPKMMIDYKEPKLLQPFTSERAKILPRRMTGNCAFHQRRVTEAVKRARILAMLPFVANFQG